MVYYAVAKGRTIGVFMSWVDCKKSIDGFAGAVFKKFDSNEDAEKFVKTGFTTVLFTKKIVKNTVKNTDVTFDSESESDLKNKTLNIKSKKNYISLKEENKIVSSKKEEEIKQSLNFDSSESESESELENLKKSTKKYTNNLGNFLPDIIVYTDGACIANGKPNAKASIGIYFGPNDSRNVSKKIEGKQSNNTAELSALITAFKILEDDINLEKKIAFFSDSVYAIWCLSTYGEKCEKNNWIKDIPNKDLVRQGYELFKGKLNIKLIHINSHTGLTDIHSLGNEEADKLASLALGIVESNKTKVNKIFLQVPYEKKEQAKQLGCKWNQSNKKWYITEKNEEIFKYFKPLSNNI